MGVWSFSKTVGVWDDHPLLDCLYEYAEVECEVHILCDLYFGFEGNRLEPPGGFEGHFRECRGDAD